MYTQKRATTNNNKNIFFLRAHVAEELTEPLAYSLPSSQDLRHRLVCPLPCLKEVSVVRNVQRDPAKYDPELFELTIGILRQLLHKFFLVTTRNRWGLGI